MFKTDIVSYDSPNIKGSSTSIQNEKNINIEEIISMLQKGEMFIKYGKKGSPHKRYVKLSNDGKCIMWRNMTGCNIFTKIKQIKISEVIK